MKPLHATLLFLATVVVVYRSLHGGNPWPIAALVAAPLLGPFLLIPLKIRRTQWIALDRIVEAIDVDGPGVPADAREFLREAEAQLASLGFTPVATLGSVGKFSNASGFLALFRNPETKEVGRSLFAIGTAAGRRRVSSLVVYCTAFGDGTEVLTANRKTVRNLPRQGPPIVAYNLPQVDDPAELLALHRALVARSEGGRIRVEPIGDDPFGYQERVERRQLDHNLACGYYTEDPDANVQRFTWMGAYLSTWRLMWPVKPLILAAERRAAARLIRSIAAGRREA